MGTGAVFGLTSALVGETLPGSGPAVATGNALAEGPVIFYWPQQVIDEIEDRAKVDNNGEWAQLRVDLFRHVLILTRTTKPALHTWQAKERRSHKKLAHNSLRALSSGVMWSKLSRLLSFLLFQDFRTSVSWPHFCVAQLGQKELLFLDGSLPGITSCYSCKSQGSFFLQLYHRFCPQAQVLAEDFECPL